MQSPMNRMHRVVLILFLFGLTAGCRPSEQRRDYYFADEDLIEWAGPFTLKTEPPLTFDDRIYYNDRGEPYTGIWITSYPDGQMEWRAQCSKGRLHGEVKSYYRDGSPAQVRQYEYGVLKGTFEEWYPNGDVKLLGTIAGPAASGGDRITDFTVGFYFEGELNIMERDKGRIQMINNAGRTPYENEIIELSMQKGYMLFGYTWWGTLETIAIDSRGEYAAFQNWDEYGK